MRSLKKWQLFLVSLVLTLVALQAADKEHLSTSSYNYYVLEALASMPQGGGYSTSSLAMARLSQAVSMSNGKLSITPSRAEPSFCSEAVYLVFLKTILRLQEHGLALTSETLTELQPKSEPDGKGLWGRWNANGPGTARLFNELKLGPNFSNLAAAQPGDFLKIFWTDAIGAREHGHLVIYLGTEKKDGVPTITFWSSNKSTNGYGKKSIPQARIRRMIFSRLTTPQNILNASLLPKTDLYLASLLSRDSSAEEMKRACGIIDL